MTKQFTLLRNQYTVTTGWSWNHFGIGTGILVEKVYKMIYISILWLILVFEQSSEVKP